MSINSCTKTIARLQRDRGELNAAMACLSRGRHYRIRRAVEKEMTFIRRSIRDLEAECFTLIRGGKDRA
ncbi:MAG: hypothetical protein AAF442_05335 [Pseudomonadota bacterium]